MRRYNPLSFARYTREIPFPIIQQVRDEVWRVFGNNGIRMRDLRDQNDWSRELWRCWDQFDFPDLSSYLPPEIGYRNINFNVLPQAIGNYEYSEARESMTQLISDSSVSTMQEIIKYLYDISAAFLMLEGKGVSGSDNFTPNRAVLSFTERPFSQFNAAYALRGFTRKNTLDIPLVLWEIMRIQPKEIYDKMLAIVKSNQYPPTMLRCELEKLSKPVQSKVFIQRAFGELVEEVIVLETKEFGYECALDALLEALPNVYTTKNEPSLKERYSTEWKDQLDELDNYLVEMKGCSGITMRKLLEAIQKGGTHQLIPFQVVKKIPILVCYEEDGMMCLDRNDIKDEMSFVPASKKKTMDIREIVRNNAMTTCFVLHENHWYVWSRRNDSSDILKIAKKTANKQYSKQSNAKEIFSKPTRTHIVVPDKPWAEWIDINLRMENEIYSNCRNSLCSLVTGAGGSGKSEMFKHLKQRLEATGMRVQICSHQAVVGMEIYKDVGGGCTLHKLFNSFNRCGDQDIGDWDVAMLHGCHLANIDCILLDEVGNNQQGWIRYIDRRLKFIAKQMKNNRYGRHETKNPELPFGGYPIVFAGDFMQLMPVHVPEEEGRVFLHRELALITRQGRSYELKAPFRFIDPNIQSEDKLNYATAMANWRFNHATPWFIKKMEDCHREELDWDTLDVDTNLPIKDQLVFICLYNTETNKKGERRSERDISCLEIHQKLAVRRPHTISIRNIIKDNIDRAQKRGMCWFIDDYCLSKRATLPENNRAKDDMLLFEGCPLMITTNKPNAEPAIVCNGCCVTYEGNDGLALKLRWQNRRVLLYPTRYKGYYYYPIKPAMARTVDGMQGNTRDRIILIVPKKVLSNKGKSKIRKHQPYVALSRARTMDGFIWTGDKKFLNSSMVDRLCVNFSRDPTKSYYPLVQSHTDFHTDQNFREMVHVTDQYGVIQKYTVANKRETRQGLTKDYLWSEAMRYTKHMFVFDKETKNEKKGLFCYCMWVRYYYGGLIEYPDAIMDENGQLTHPKYEIDADNQMIYFEWDQDKDNMPSRDFAQIILSIILRGIALLGTDQDKMHFPLVLRGFNSNGFDIYFMLRELLNNTPIAQRMRAYITRTSGSSNKGISLVYCYQDDKGCQREQVILHSYDTYQILSTGTLEANLQSSVYPLFDKTEDEYAKAVCNPLEYLIYQGKTNDEIYHIMDQIHNRDGARPVVDGVDPWDVRASYIQNILDNRHKLLDVRRSYRNRTKKGEAPLLYMNEIKTWEEFKDLRNPKPWLQMLDNPPWGYNYSKFYYDRELDKAKQHIQENPEYYENYNILWNIKDYAKQDVEVTDLLTRVLNNTIYEFDIKGKQLQLSVDRFETTCSLTGYLSVLFMEDQFKKQRMGARKIETKLPLYDERKYDMMRRSCGGKTLPRFLHYVADEKHPPLVCLDVSGMYSAAMMKQVYPYGAYSELDYNNEEDRPILERVRKLLNKQQYYEFSHEDKPTTTCWIGIVTRSMHPREIDPPAGVKIPRVGHTLKEPNPTDVPVYTKRLDQLWHLNRPLVAQESNVSCMDIVRAKGKIHRIHHLTYWEYEGKIYESYMKHMAQKKQEAQDNGQYATRDLCKLMMNTEYGNNGKQNFLTGNVWASGDEIVYADDQFLNGPYNATWMDLDNGSRVYNFTCNNFGVSDRSTSISSFTLAYSKQILNRAIQVMYGDDRHTNPFPYTSAYTDTDSLYVPLPALRRLIEEDKKNDDIETQILYYGTHDEFKPGKFADEIADEVMKKAKKKGTPYHKSFPNFDKGYHTEITDMTPPHPKLYAAKYRYPPVNSDEDHIPPRSEWHIGYKFRGRGMPAKCILSIDETKLTPAQQIEWDEIKDRIPLKEGTGEKDMRCQSNQSTYEIFTFCVLNKIVLETETPGLVKYLENKNNDLSFTIQDKSLPRKQLQHPYKGRRAIPNSEEDKDWKGVYTTPPDWKNWNKWPKRYIQDAYQKAEYMLNMFT